MQAMTGTGNGGFKTESSSTHSLPDPGSRAKTSVAGSPAPASTPLTFVVEGGRPRRRRALKQAMRLNGLLAVPARRPTASSPRERSKRLFAISRISCPRIPERATSGTPRSRISSSCTGAQPGPAAPPAPQVKARKMPGGRSCRISLRRRLSRLEAR